MTARVTVASGEPARLSVTTAQRGARGASAYEVAVANGYSGTEEEWLDSLQFSLGSNVTAVIALTQAEYEAIETPDPTTLYLIRI